MAWISRRSSDRALVAALTALAAVMFGWGFQHGRTHPYYTAAVRSMGANWHDFVYGAFDPAGFITTDKLPGAFWVQALSVRMFGFHPWAVLLPQVLAATACVPLLFVTVRRWAGRGAGYAAAVGYTLTPVTVALSRTNIPDALMVFFMVVAAHALWRWADGGRRAAWWLAASAVWLGVAFNVKMGQALLVVPVFAGTCFLLGAGTRWWRLGRAAAYGALVAAVSLAWMVFVTLTPASQRPYIDGSVHNSVWEMVFQYNGFGRIGGQGAGTDPLAGGAVLSGAGGPAGLGRIFGAASAGQISWLVPAAVAGLGAGLWVAWRGRRAGLTVRAGLAARAALGALAEADSAHQPATPAATTTSAQDPTTAAPTAVAIPQQEPGDAAPASLQPTAADRARQKALAGYLLWGGWLGIYGLAFCAATGIHSYYTSTLAPPVAALAGAAFIAAARGRAWQLPALVAVTGGWAFFASRETPHYQPWLRWFVLAAAVLAIALTPWARISRNRAVGALSALAVATAALAAPAVWASSVLTRRGDMMGSVAASAGPPQSMFGGRKTSAAVNDEIERGLRDFGQGPDPQVLRFLEHNRGGRPYAAAVDGSMAAATYLAHNVPVLPMGGFTSDAPAPTAQGLAALVRTGQVRYVVVTGMRMGGRSTAAKDRDSWVTGHCHGVPGLVSVSVPRSTSTSASTSTTSTTSTAHAAKAAAPSGVFDCS
ncbi:4-amino-4-deoxy-L-arabinose transferase-like glycosyltransferase [Catenulispora sp. GAS73]|uniref:ArnT family glycosyltransferase n=1 Tax=Catenulispora sp. GAS73 TaxID=3156269 RepID=UPI00351618AC